MIELNHQNQSVTLNQSGAVVMRYRVGDEDILFPRQQLDSSTRGGSHVCLPNFGPDDKTDQPQHGYGRLVDWEVLSQTSDSVVFMHTQTEGVYKGLVSELKYSLSRTGFSMELKLENKGVNTLEVAPGFHPYFTLSEGVEIVEVNEASFDTARIEHTEWAEAPELIELSLGSRRVQITQDNLSKIAIWSEHSTRYVCIEPTFAGNAHTKNSSSAKQLPSGQKAYYSMTIRPHINIL